MTQEQYDSERSAFAAENAQVQSARTQLNVSRAQIESARSAVTSANAELSVIESQLNNTRLYAPIDGVVAKRWLLPGDVVQPGQSVLTVTNNQNLWIAVYLEETKIADVHVDQEVDFTLDAYPDVLFTGKVTSIGSNTASQFSLIPQNNASGNFTKVTQRIPLKVSIEDTDHQEGLAGVHILAGMSAAVKIKRDL
jgi:membrane fusion protein (multidrug efflux system)